jgi:signal transduction histidine kinase
MLKTSGINTHIDASRFNKSLLNNEQKLAIYRIGQEQCTNIIKYSKATLVNVSLSTDEKSFKMTISDNGQGMDSKKKITGIGLRNIHARLSIFNGTADIDTAPGKGFLLQIEMPLKK